MLTDRLDLEKGDIVDIVASGNGTCHPIVLEGGYPSHTLGSNGLRPP